MTDSGPKDAPPHSVVVLGAGISGLAAAYEVVRLLNADPKSAETAGESRNGKSQNGAGDLGNSHGADLVAKAHVGFAGLRSRNVQVTVLEASQRCGGLIATSQFGTRAVDEAADAFLAKATHVSELVAELGLADQLVAPATGSAWIWTAKGLQILPKGLVLGIPSRLGPLWSSKMLSKVSVARAALDLILPGAPLKADEAIGGVIRRRLGHKVHELLVDPLISGINAGRSDELSIEASAPVLAQAAKQRTSLIRGVRSQARVAHKNKEGNETAPPNPIFWGLKGGMGTLVEALQTALVSAGGVIEFGQEIRSIRRSEGRWLIESATGEHYADSVILATPAYVTAKLLAGELPAASSILSRVQYASVAMVTLAYRESALSKRREGSGFLVPRTKGRLVTACSWTTNKWPHLGSPGEFVMRASVGRIDSNEELSLDDKTLVSRVDAELKEAMGMNEGPVMSRISRWNRAFPQYAVGHLQQIAIVQSLVATLPGISLAGSTYGGVGIPACIESGFAAARSILEHININKEGLGSSGISSSAPTNS